MRIYLCGPINACTDSEAKDWREFIKTHHGLTAWAKFIDPMVRDYRGREHEDYREIVDLDKQDVRSCDVILVMYTKPSVGTAMETYMAWTLGIPVIVIDRSGKPISPWMRYHSTAIVSDEAEAVRKLRQWKRT